MWQIEYGLWSRIRQASKKEFFSSHKYMRMWEMVDAILIFHKSPQSPQEEVIISLDWNMCFFDIISFRFTPCTWKNFSRHLYMRLWMDRCSAERIKSKACTHFSKISSKYRLYNFLNMRHHWNVDTYIHIIAQQVTTLDINYDGTKHRAIIRF